MSNIEIFKALADPTRLKILECVKNSEKCICDIIPSTGKSQPNVSLHLKILRQAGLIHERKDGTKTMIRIANNKVFTLIDVAEQMK
jgi:ArsR family transcriptional regulator